MKLELLAAARSCEDHFLSPIPVIVVIGDDLIEDAVDVSRGVPLVPPERS